MTTQTEIASSSRATAQAYAVAAHAARIQRLAALGRATLKAKAAEVKAAMARQGRCPSAWQDGTMACLEGQIEDMREAWKLAK